MRTAEHSPPPRRALTWVVVCGFALALALRIWTLSGVLPLVQHPDEPENEHVVLQVAHAPFASPGFFKYPSLMFYLEAVVARGYEAATRARIAPITILAAGDARTSFSGFWRLARLLTAVLGSLGVGIAVWLTERVSHSLRAAIIVAIWTATSPLLVDNARFIAPDVYAGFFALAAVAAATRIVEGAGWRAYLVAGALVGLAASAKYNLAAAAVAVPVAHFAGPGQRRLGDYRLWLSGVLAGCAFLATTPFAALDYAHFHDGLLFEMAHYAHGHAGAEGSSLVSNLHDLWASESWRLLGLIGLCWMRDRRTIRLLTPALAFVLVYFCLLSSMKVHFARNLVPLASPLLLLCGLGAWTVINLRPRAKARLALTGLCALVSSLAPLASVMKSARENQTNLRSDAEQWLATHLRSGSRVVLEPYGPWVDPHRFHVSRSSILGDMPHPPPALGHSDYLIVSEDAYGRYYADKARYSVEVERYEAVFRRTCVLATFGVGSGHAIKVLDLRCKPPA